MKTRLSTYRRMRQATATPEPFGGTGGRRGLFVVQKHAATRAHYDFRIESEGVLMSWAIPRGPCFDPSVKRLAVRTEDHPIEYADFEGVIPEGQYGAGNVIVWDQGRWQPLEPLEEGLSTGKLLFELWGHKLRGVWTLVRTKRQRGTVKGESQEWLLIKKPDAWGRPGVDVPDTSVFSGLAVEDVQAGPDRLSAMCDELAAEQTPQSDLDFEQFEVMLAQRETHAFDDDAWLFEMKFDGYRLASRIEQNQVKLRYRSGIECTDLFPDIARCLLALPYWPVVFDGEVVVLDNEGRPRFQLLQQRTQLSSHAQILQACVTHPAVYYVFDVLELGGFDLRSWPLTARKNLLQRIVPEAGWVRFSDHVWASGRKLFKEMESRGLEGIVAKKHDSSYVHGRSSHWKKIRVQHTDDFVVVGYAKGKGSRGALGSLHLAQWNARDACWQYCGRVGTGFSDSDLEAIHEALQPWLRDEVPGMRGAVPTSASHVWVEPKLVVEVRYVEVTAEGRLRQPSFLRARVDKQARECLWVADRSEPEMSPAVSAEEPQTQRTFQVTNPKKIFWPQDGYTKGDLIQFYRDIAAWALPYLRDRPVVLTRYPDGIDGKSFFQKDAPEWIPHWVRTQRMWSEHAEREIDYFVCDDAETLAFLANMGTIPLHVWSSRVAALSRPDWCILDLDPKQAPFGYVVDLALTIKQLCDEIEMPCYVKTSGSTGLHILLPLGGQVTFEQSRQFALLIANFVADQHPEQATIERTMRKRGSRVYLDALQNGHGRLLVAPFSVRPRALAPVSTPLAWNEVSKRLQITDHTMATLHKRLQRQKDCPLRGLMTDKPDLAVVLARLEDHIRAAGYVL